MTKSQMKQAIDEAISNGPMMNENFVQKILNDKKRPKKTIPFLQPALVVVMMLVIGTLLYFSPSQTKQSAVEIKEYSLTDTQAKLVEGFYTAIAMKDEKALAKVATMSNEEVINRYKAFDLTKQIEVIKTIDDEKELMLYIKLRGATYSYLEKLVLDKESEKFIISDAYEFLFYEEDIELPKSIALTYQDAPIATPMKTTPWKLDKAEQQTINGNTLYQIETKEGMQRIFESFSGERFDLGIASEGISYFNSGESNQFFIIDTLTKQMTYIYLNQQGTYQMITGELDWQSITQYQTEFHDAPFIVTGGTQPKIMTIQNDKLIYANIFANAEFVQPLEFYSSESYGDSLLVKYTEDLRQTSQYFELKSMNLYEDYRLRDMLIAKPEHFKDMSLTNRYKDQLIYIFNEGTIYYRGKTSTGELIEKTYTNIQIETMDNQYFITGDDGFSWTLTRTAPRILQDEKGIEYTIPIAFEDIPQN
ncbi:hypothetical protein LZ480_14010 [Solibacillus sp. MA9]|uniref:DUF4367 domain-containing protein n=1 Tax=Solibacillus palustris TaxID=2908203 RepID=A0ABS9UFX8_9BACL|nr:hypothetical protein [Solibacillus sp. MA9]MCH7322989.1 hypothetical protein [Solibacillus sp. MA9]